MNVTVIGTGYVGLVAGTCFAEAGNDVWCIDLDVIRIHQLKNGFIPIYEKGLEQLIAKNYHAGRLHFSTDLLDGLDDALFICIAVGTPPHEDGSADLRCVLEVAGKIGDHIKDYKVIIMKSTAPVGTVEKIKTVIRERLNDRKLAIEFDVVSNPEFLKEGDAVVDFMNPDRIIVGTTSKKARTYMTRLYAPFLRQEGILYMDEKSAELSKYASNAMLATKISFINEIANYCEHCGADIEMVRRGIGSDHRIGYAFIYPGIGYGGSCFPKDVKALIRMAHVHGLEMKVLHAVEEVNNRQKSRIFEKIHSYYHAKAETLKGKTIAVWGLSFKPETDDMREAPSLVTIRKLIEHGAFIHAHDPAALDMAKKYFSDIGDKIKYFEDKYQCLNGAAALVLLTEWLLYKKPDFRRMLEDYKIRVIFDGRNQYDRRELEELGIDYYCIGRRTYRQPEHLPASK